MSAGQRWQRGSGRSLAWRSSLSPCSPSCVLSGGRRPVRCHSGSTPASTRPRSTARSGAWPWWTRAGGCSTAETQRPALHPRQQHQAGGERRGRGAAAARLDRQDQSLCGGPVVGGVLQGDLVLYGRGDPTMDRTLLRHGYHRRPASATPIPSPGSASWPTRSEREGSSTVAGDIVGDGSYFEPHARPSQLGDVRPQLVVRRAGLGPRLPRQQHRLQLAAGAGRRARPPSITMKPDLGDLAFENRTLTVPPGGETDMGDRFFRPPGTLSIWAEGTVALDHPPADRIVRACRIPTSMPPAHCGRRWLRPASPSPGPPARPPTRCSTATLRHTAPLAEVAARGRCATGSFRS